MPKLGIEESAKSIVNCQAFSMLLNWVIPKVAAATLEWPFLFSCETLPMEFTITSRLFIAAAFLLGCGISTDAQDAPMKAPTTAEPTAKETKERSREQKLADYLSGAKFVGQFTIDGQDVAPKTEEYTLGSCEVLDQPNMYRLKARIKYGDVDNELPLDIKILWSGNTPVITLDGFWIPAMGTFGARVMIHSNRYAGTWQHDEVGGHMFGKIIQAEASNDAKEMQEMETK